MSIESVSVLGCGWLGQPLAIALKEQGFTILGSNRTQAKADTLSALGIRPFVVNLASSDEIPKAFLNSDLLIIAVTSKAADEYKRLLEQLMDHPLRKVIFVSSTSVYPDINDIVDEQTPVSHSPLAEIEVMFREVTTLETIILRFGGLYGYNRQPGNFFPPGKMIPNPEGYVNMIHRDDCIAIINKMIRKPFLNETFNACSDAHPSRRAFYTQEAIKMGNPVPQFDESGNRHFKIVSNAKLKNHLNYTFIHPELMD